MVLTQELPLVAAKQPEQIPVEFQAYEYQKRLYLEGFDAGYTRGAKLVADKIIRYVELPPDLSEIGRLAYLNGNIHGFTLFVKEHERSRIVAAAAAPAAPLTS